MSYWTNRQEQLKKTAEKDEAKLKRRLSDFYDKEFKRLDTGDCFILSAIWC